MSEIKDIRKVKINHLEGDWVDGDKHIYFPNPLTLNDLSDEDLFKERDFCKGKVAELYLKRVIPFVWFFLGTALVLYCLITIILPNLFQITHTDLAILFLSMIVGCVFPACIIGWMRYNDDDLLLDYKFNYKESTKILRRRGKL